MNEMMCTMKRGVRQAYRRAEANVRYVNAVLVRDERGDTNFVSILVLLGIAMVLAAIFLGFRQQIVDWASKQMGVFTGTANSQTNGTYTKLS